MKSQSFSKGFSKPKIEPIKRDDWQRYIVEMKRRYLADNSELLIGTAEILVPKKLHDPLSRERKRTVWDCFATASAHHLLFLDESRSRQVNQVFVFDNQFRIIERIELNSWQETNSQSDSMKEITESDWTLIELAVAQCQVSLQWLLVPQVA